MNNTKTKPTITIGIPAYNEEHNIGRMLIEILRQKTEQVELTEIIVVSDGSTDKTADMVSTINDARICLIDDGQRRGKSARMNQIFSMARGGIIVLLDADIHLGNNNVIEQLAKPFMDNPDTALVGGAHFPLPQETIIEKAVANYTRSREYIRQHWRGGQNPAGFWGCILALSTSFAKEVKVPLDSSNDAYLYLFARSKGYRVKYQPEAIVYFRCPQTAKDQISQGARFNAGGKHMREYFDSEFVNQEYYIPFYLKAYSLGYQAIKNPAAYLVMKILSIACTIRAHETNNLPNGQWKIASSSKKIS